MFDLKEQVVDLNKSTSLMWMSLILRFGQTVWQALKPVVTNDTFAFIFWDMLWTRHMTEHQSSILKKKKVTSTKP